MLNIIKKIAYKIKCFMDPTIPYEKAVNDYLKALDKFVCPNGKFSLERWKFIKKRGLL